MKGLVKQLSALGGTGFAAACCLGFPAVVGAVAALGLGFLINDFILFPLFFGLLGFTLWTLYRSTRSHGAMAPFWLGVVGAAVASMGVFGISWLAWTGLGALLAGSLWNFWSRRQQLASTPP